MELLCIGILQPGSKIRLPDMVNIGDYTGGSSGQHLMDDNKPRHLGVKEAETRLKGNFNAISTVLPIPCLVTGNSRVGVFNGLNENRSIRGEKEKQRGVIRSKRKLVMGSDTNGNGLVKKRHIKVRLLA